MEIQVFGGVIGSLRGLRDLSGIRDCFLSDFLGGMVVSLLERKKWVKRKLPDDWILAFVWPFLID
jgi:hypothetical protein